jgi:hypothetical protein
LFKAINISGPAPLFSATSKNGGRTLKPTIISTLSLERSFAAKNNEFIIKKKKAENSSLKISQ